MPARATPAGSAIRRTRRWPSWAPSPAASAWATAPGTVKGKNPFDYLQSTDLVAGSTGIDVTNAPVYYSRLIMAYVAMDKAGSIGTAGSKGVNLLNILLTYQNTTDGSSNKGPSPRPSRPSKPRCAPPAGRSSPCTTQA